MVWMRQKQWKWEGKNTEKWNQCNFADRWNADCERERSKMTPVFLSWVTRRRKLLFPREGSVWGHRCGVWLWQRKPGVCFGLCWAEMLSHYSVRMSGRQRDVWWRSPRRIQKMVVPLAIEVSIASLTWVVWAQQSTFSSMCLNSEPSDK